MSSVQQNKPEEPAKKAWSLSDHIAHLRGQFETIDQAIVAHQAEQTQQGVAMGVVYEKQSRKTRTRCRK